MRFNSEFKGLKERAVTISAYERRERCEAVATRPSDTSAYSTGLYDVLSQKTEKF